MSADETSDDNNVVCPHCGYEHGDAWEYTEDHESKTECYGCDKPFMQWREIVVTYHARAIDVPEQSCDSDEPRT